MRTVLRAFVAASVLTFWLPMPIFPLESPALQSQQANKQKAPEQARWEGMVVRTDPNEKTLTVRKRGSTMEKTIHYDSSTQFVSQEHRSKKVNTIDASDIKENDRVICRGNYDEKGNFHANLVSKRLTP